MPACTELIENTFSFNVSDGKMYINYEDSIKIKFKSKSITINTKIYLYHIHVSITYIVPDMLLPSNEKNK